MKNYKKHGFTLIELAIACVVIGLVIVGVLAGRSLIKSAKINKTISDFATYKSAHFTFYNKYEYYAGDIPFAVRLWGAQVGGTADGPDDDCADTNDAATGTATCNGDGSGIVADSGTDWANIAVNVFRKQWYETGRYWQHLSNEGLIKGQYAGATFGGRSQQAQTVGENIPEADYLGSDAGWTIRFRRWGANGDWFDAIEGHFLVLGNGTQPDLAGPVFTSEEAKIIDEKIDDGKPGTGLVFPYTGTGSHNVGCTDTGDADAIYVVSNPGIICSLNFGLK